MPVDETVYLAGATLGVSGSNGELWRWDIKGQALHPVANLTPEGWKTPLTHPLSTRGGFFFRGYSAAAGFELWRSLGTPATTGLVKDIFPGATGSLSNAEEEKLFEGPTGHVFFSANTSSAGPELWRSDGSAAGTVQVRDIVQGSQGSYPSGFLTLGDHLAFSAAGKLWSSDGTAEGTAVVKEIGTAQTSADPKFLTRLGERMVFIANDGEHGSELWTSDGTATGTLLVKDIYQGTGDVWPRIFGVAGNLAFFDQLGPSNKYGLYVTDGTADGTRRCGRRSTLQPQGCSSHGRHIILHSHFGSG